MARRQATPKGPKVAFNGNEASSINEAIRRMCMQQVNGAKQPFSAKDLLELFVEPADRAVLCRAWELVEPAGTTQQLYCGFLKPLNVLEGDLGRTHAYLRFQWTYESLRHGFYVPSACGGRTNQAASVRPDARPELRDLINETFNTMLDIYWRFAQVHRVFNILNRPGACKTPAEMRYVWPCTYTLARQAGLHAIADTIENPSPRAGDTVGVFSRYAIENIHPTSNTIARAMLLNDVRVDLSHLPIPYDMLHGFNDTIIPT